MRTRSQPISPNGFQSLDMSAPQRRRRKPPAQAATKTTEVATPSEPKPKANSAKVNRRAPTKQGGKRKAGAAKRRTATAPSEESEPQHQPKQTDESKPAQQREQQQKQQQQSVLADAENIPPREQPVEQSELPSTSASEPVVPSAPTFQPSIPSLSPALSPASPPIPVQHGVSTFISVEASSENQSEPAAAASAGAFSTSITGMAERPIAPTSPFSTSTSSLTGNALRVAENFPNAQTTPDRRRSYPPAATPANPAQGRRSSIRAQPLAPSTPYRAPLRVIAQPHSRRSSAPNSRVGHNSCSNNSMTGGSPSAKMPPTATQSTLVQSTPVQSTPAQSTRTQSIPTQPTSAQSPASAISARRRRRLTYSRPVLQPGTPTCACCKNPTCPNNRGSSPSVYTSYQCTPPPGTPTPKWDTLIRGTRQSVGFNKRRHSMLSDDENDTTPSRPAKRRSNVSVSKVAHHRLNNTVPYLLRRSRRLDLSRVREEQQRFLEYPGRRYLDMNNKENEGEMTATGAVQAQGSNFVADPSVPQPPHPYESPRTEPTEPTELPHVEDQTIMEPPQAQANRWNIRGILSAVPQTLSRVWTRRPFHAAVPAPEQTLQQPAPTTDQNETAAHEIHPANAVGAEARGNAAHPIETGAADTGSAETVTTPQADANVNANAMDMNFETLPFWARYDPLDPDVHKYRPPPVDPEHCPVHGRRTAEAPTPAAETNEAAVDAAPVDVVPADATLINDPSPRNAVPANATVVDHTQTPSTPIDTVFPDAASANASLTATPTEQAQGRKRRRDSTEAVTDVVENRYEANTSRVATDSGKSGMESENKVPGDSSNAAPNGEGVSARAPPKKRVRFALDSPNVSPENRMSSGPTASGALLSTHSRSLLQSPGTLHSSPSSVSRRVQDPFELALPQPSRVIEPQASSSALSTTVTQASSARTTTTTERERIRAAKRAERKRRRRAELAARGVRNFSGVFELRYEDFSSSDEEYETEQTSVQQSESGQPLHQAQIEEPPRQQQQTEEPRDIEMGEPSPEQRADKPTRAEYPWEMPDIVREARRNIRDRKRAPALLARGITNLRGTFQLLDEDFESTDEEELAREVTRLQEAKDSSRAACPAAPVEPTPVHENQVQVQEAPQIPAPSVVAAEQTPAYQIQAEIEGPDSARFPDTTEPAPAHPMRVETEGAHPAPFSTSAKSAAATKANVALVQWPQSAALAGVYQTGGNPPTFGGVVSLT